MLWCIYFLLFLVSDSIGLGSYTCNHSVLPCILLIHTNRRQKEYACLLLFQTRVWCQVHNVICTCGEDMNPIRDATPWPHRDLRSSHVTDTSNRWQASTQCVDLFITFNREKMQFESIFSFCSSTMLHIRTLRARSYMFSVHDPGKMFSEQVLGTQAFTLRALWNVLGTPSFRFKLGTHLGLRSMTYCVYTAQHVRSF